MRTKHFSTEPLGMPVCGAKGCGPLVTTFTGFVDCARCERSKAFKTQKALDDVRIAGTGAVNNTKGRQT